MNNLEIQVINISPIGRITNNIRDIKNKLNEVFLNSEQNHIFNIIKETEIVFTKVVNDSITYQQKSQLFHQLNQSWFDLWQHYRHIPEAFELVSLIDKMTNICTAYTKLLLGLSLINEIKVEEEEINLHNTVEGCQLMSETIDVFIDIFAVSELQQMYQNASQILASTYRDIHEYFHDSSISTLITQIRAYCSLIIIRVSEYLKKIELSDLNFREETQENVEFDRAYTFLKTAKNLTIDAPADFSENINSYLYGKIDDNK
ncbi:hypothetical protein [Geminocystis sp. GBBB08]|uniref:hypothetical protein n=1 Tax=Geminocystis sp. GBBB08 TaxID=2604140 RepID=UPI0027E39C66|nr:hypothetical protein [Geminocystis sp. GBBB08]MBL1209131.1 hypothetical protein [Geminocystis sp. GBBB08]